MGEQKIEKILVNAETMKQMFDLSWCDKTLKRRIESGFPAMRDGHDLLFNPQEVMEYFKKRRAKR